MLTTNEKQANGYVISTLEMQCCLGASIPSGGEHTDNHSKGGQDKAKLTGIRYLITKFSDIAALTNAQEHQTEQDLAPPGHLSVELSI